MLRGQGVGGSNLSPSDLEFANSVQEGISPERTRPNVRFGSFLSWRTIGTFCVGAMFHRGCQDTSSSIPKWSRR
jgi:hypothetical protein